MYKKECFRNTYKYDNFYLKEVSKRFKILTMHQILVFGLYPNDQNFHSNSLEIKFSIAPPNS